MMIFKKVYMVKRRSNLQGLSNVICVRLFYFFLISYTLNMFMEVEVDLDKRNGMSEV